MKRTVVVTRARPVVFLKFLEQDTIKLRESDMGDIAYPNASAGFLYKIP